jgi:hypothetical protein
VEEELKILQCRPAKMDAPWLVSMNGRREIRLQWNYSGLSLKKRKPVEESKRRRLRAVDCVCVAEAGEPAGKKEELMLIPGGLPLPLPLPAGGPHVWAPASLRGFPGACSRTRCLPSGSPHQPDLG